MPLFNEDTSTRILEHIQHASTSALAHSLLPFYTSAGATTKTPSSSTTTPPDGTDDDAEDDFEMFMAQTTQPAQPSRCARSQRRRQRGEEVCGSA